ncbi:MAG: C45 family peptidase, partial [Candidatus Xenobia bacterium]
MIEFLELHGTPRQRGEQHGEALREQVRQLFEIRRELLYKRSPVKDPARITRLADAQWAVSERYFPGLCEEMDGIARAAGVTREAMVILNNYTDFRDIGPGVEGCTAVYVHHDDGVYLGQTWDMHASAEPFVVGM